ncbi:MAG TPA: DUF1223 domain-containing protein [Gammaproteobacteria bacterium]|nr:DUF1223 domain-containing protein [Gammaproteobacteria bacterium]
MAVIIERIRARRHAGWALALLALLSAGSVPAAPLLLDSGARQVTLLELFTSQGCSSCPPAERWLNRLVDDADLWTEIVPLAFHVDYWDYIGWQDPFAAAAYGERQRDYARAGRARTVYTPGLFANGREWRGWTFGLGPRRSDREPGSLVAAIDGDRLTATYPAAGRSLELHVALLGSGIETAVERGENRGRTLAQEFVVLAHSIHVSDNGQWAVELPRADAGQVQRYGIALWVSTADNPAPLQATGTWLP